MQKRSTARTINKSTQVTYGNSSRDVVKQRCASFGCAWSARRGRRLVVLPPVRGSLGRYRRVRSCESPRAPDVVRGSAQSLFSRVRAVVREVGFSYERPLGLADEILVATRIDWIRRTSFQMAFSVWSRGLVGRGHAICIWMRNDTGERVPLSDALRTKILAKDNSLDTRN
jgi:hypothetical protein